MRLNFKKAILSSLSNSNSNFGISPISESLNSREIIFESKMNLDSSINTNQDPIFFQNTPHTMTRISTQTNRSFFKNFMNHGLARFVAVATFMLLSINGFGQTVIAEYPFNNSLSPSVGAFGDAVYGTGAATLNATDICTDAASSLSNSLVIPTISTLNLTSFQIDVDINVTALPSGSLPGFVYIMSSGSRAFGLAVNPNGTIRVDYQLSTGTSVATQSSTQSITAGSNHSVSVQLVSNSIRVKLDGTLVIVHDMQTALPNIGSTNRNFYLGDHPAGALPLAVCVDNFKVTNNPTQFVFGESIIRSATSVTGLNSYSGEVSTAKTFSVSASNISSDLLITAPYFFEVSLTPTSGFGSSVTVAQSSGTVSSTTVYVRMTNHTTITNLIGANARILTLTAGMYSSTILLEGIKSVAPMSIISLSTSHAKIGSTVTITGRNFTNNSATKVKLG